MRGFLKEVPALGGVLLLAVQLACAKPQKTHKRPKPAAAKPNKRTSKALSSKLLEAARKGKIREAVRLIELGADVNARDGKGNTALHYAANNDDPGLVRVLLEHGADPNVRNKVGETPLYLTDSLEVTKLLLEHGADPNIPTKDGTPPLWEAVANGWCKRAALLIAHGADAKWTYKGDGSNLLHESARRCNAEVVRLLIEHGAKVNGKDNEGCTPLHYMARWDSAQSARVLLEYGADPNARNNYGQTPLHWAAVDGHDDVARVLLEHGADVNVRDKEGKTPLDLAATPQVKSLLLEKRRGR